MPLDPNTMTTEEIEALIEENRRLKKADEDWKETRTNNVVFTSEGPDDLLRKRSESRGGVYVSHDDRKRAMVAREKQKKVMRMIAGDNLQTAAALLASRGVMPAMPVAPPAPVAPPLARRGRKPKSVATPETPEEAEGQPVVTEEAGNFPV